MIFTKYLFCRTDIVVLAFIKKDQNNRDYYNVFLLYNTVQAKMLERGKQLVQASSLAPPQIKS